LRNLCPSPAGSLFKFSNTPFKPFTQATEGRLPWCPSPSLVITPVMGIAALHPELLFHSLQILQQPCTSPGQSNIQLPRYPLSSFISRNKIASVHHAGLPITRITRITYAMPQQTPHCLPGLVLAPQGPPGPSADQAGEHGPGKQNGYSGRCGRSG
jgi:hypothetical protein